MEKLDQMIVEALSEEERALGAGLEEDGIFRQIGGQFRGPNAWVHWLTTVALFAYAALALWAAVRFFTAVETADLVFWGIIGAVSIVVIGMLKLYMLGEMQTDRVIRELKRVQLILAAREK